MAGQEQIDNFLQSLSFEGDHQSDGSFTVSPEKARAKFREFGLSEPHYYTGVLVSALLSEGVSFVEIEADSDDFIVSSDYFASQQELEQLFSLASEEAGSSRAFRLALGLQASLALDPQKVELACWDGKLGSVLSLSEESFQVTSLSDPGWRPEVRSRIHVREKPGLRVAARFLKKTFAAQATEEQTFLQERLHLAPVPIQLNGQPLNAPPDMTACRAWIRLGQPGSDLQVLPQLPGPALVEFEAEGLTAFLGFLPEAPEQAESSLVVHGLAMPDWEFPHADRTVVYCDGLSTDLSLTKVVRDSALEALERKLEEAVAEALPELFSGPLQDQGRFPCRGDRDCSYRELQEAYERDGFLTVISDSSLEIEPYGDAPLVKSGARFLDLLFPNQVLDGQISELVPPGRYRARGFSEAGPELALAYEPGPEREASSPPRWVVHGYPEPTAKDVVALYETQPLPDLEEGLELLAFVMARRAGYGLKRVMEDPESLFRLDPESWLSRLVAHLKLPTRDGTGATLEALAYGFHTGVCWIVFSDHPLRFHEPAPETVMVSLEQQRFLTDLVGFSVMKFNREIRTGLINLQGEFVCEPDLVDLRERMSCGRLLYSRGDLWGYVDSQGAPAIEARFEQAQDFEDGSAVVCLEKDKSLLIDLDGERLAGPYELILELHDGLRLARYGERWGYLDSQGQIVIPFEFESGGHFGSGQATVTRNGQRLLINREGKVVGHCPWDYEIVGPLRHGLRFTKHEGLFGYLDAEGEWAIEPRYEIGWESNGEVVPVKAPGGLWGLVNHQGEKVTEFVYSRMATRFSEGLLAVEKEDEHGYIDSKGELVLTGFKACGPFRQGLAPVQDDRWGYIDRGGSYLIPPTYLSAGSFHEDRAVVRPYNL